MPIYPQLRSLFYFQTDNDSKQQKFQGTWIVPTLALENAKRRLDGAGAIMLEVMNELTGHWELVTLHAVYVTGASDLLSQDLLYHELGFRVIISYDQQSARLECNQNKAVWLFTKRVDHFYIVSVCGKRCVSHMIVLVVQATDIEAAIDNELALWHRRFVHTHMGILKTMARDATVDEMRMSIESLASDLERISCDCAKMPRMSLKATRLQRAAAPFEEDIMDRMLVAVPTLRGRDIVLHIVDEANRFKCIYIQ